LEDQEVKAASAPLLKFFSSLKAKKPNILHFFAPQATQFSVTNEFLFPIVNKKTLKF